MALALRCLRGNGQALSTAGSGRWLQDESEFAELAQYGRHLLEGHLRGCVFHLRQSVARGARTIEDVDRQLQFINLFDVMLNASSTIDQVRCFLFFFLECKN